MDQAVDQATSVPGLWTMRRAAYSDILIKSGCATTSLSPSAALPGEFWRQKRMLFVGFVSSRGEQLVVENTTRDATYYANRSFPIRVLRRLSVKSWRTHSGRNRCAKHSPYAFTEDKLRSLKSLLIKWQLPLSIRNCFQKRRSTCPNTAYCTTSQAQRRPAQRLKRHWKAR